MHAANGSNVPGLPPLLGTQVAIVSHGLERAYDRARGLEDSGYRAVACGEPGMAMDCVADARPDAVVIDLGRDLGFPGDVVARVRLATKAPIVVVGCAGTSAEMLRCYEAGADDYCRPRCQTEEIDLRLRAIFRRMEFVARPPATAPPRADPRGGHRNRSLTDA